MEHRGTDFPFNATLFFLGRTELIGHLPIYGGPLALLVYGSAPRLAREVAALSPLRRRQLESAHPQTDRNPPR